MKKLIALIIVLCLAFAGLVGYLANSQTAGPMVTAAPEDSEPAPDMAEPTPDASVGTEEPDADSAEPEEAAAPDYAAIYALHAPEDVVLTVDGQDVTWGKYFYMLFTQAQQMTSYFDTLAYYYGMEQSWDDEYADGVTYAQVAVDSAEDTLVQLAAIKGFAAANNVALPEDVQTLLDEQLQADITAACGEGATEADFEAYLSEIYMDLDLYRWIYETNFLYQQNYLQLYGENGELFDEAAALAWLEDNGYLSASHILLMTIDQATGEALDEATVQQKLSDAQAIAAELQAIADTDELLARFAQIKAERCEDTGKVAYPDGYTFTPGTMVTEFEDTVNALGAYQVSDVVETSYGYHVIMRLPLSTDAVIQFASDGVTPMTAKSMASNEEYGARLQAYYDDLSIEYVNGFEPVDLMDYIVK